MFSISQFSFRMYFVTCLCLCVFSLSAYGQTIDRQQLLTEIVNLRAQLVFNTDQALVASLTEQLKTKEKLFLAPAPSDWTDNAALLAQPDTGLVRLQPREKFDGTLLTRGGGAFYSFVRLVHEYGFGSDLALEQNQFSVGFAGADFGFLTAVGTGEFRDVTLAHPGVKYAAEFVPPLAEPDARIQQQRTSQGFSVNGFSYSRRLAVLLNTNYVVRSVGYGDSDVLVAFRATRQDADGSLILVWKLLKWFATPQLNGSSSIATTSAASYARGVYAPGSIVTLFGTGMTTETQVAATSPLPTSLAGASVTFFPGNQGGRAVPLFVASPNQINFLIPATAPAGWGMISVRRADGTAHYELIRIEPVAPGLFTANADGQGVPAAVLLRVPAAGPQRYEPVARYDSDIKKFVPVPIGTTTFTEGVFLVLFGTGLRGYSSPAKVTATIGGIVVPVTYVGEQGSAGLDQVNLVLPPTLAGKGEVDLQLVVDDKPANVVRLLFK